MGELLAAALYYAQLGWFVFVLGATKRPIANCPACRDAPDDHNRRTCECLTCHGFYASTRDPARIAAMVKAIPRPMLAVETGERSGIVVLDGDPRHGGAVDRSLMPATAWVRTGSGGWHGYYQWPGVPVPCSQSRIGPGVDVRGDGGYAVLPPSVHPRTGRPYEWVRRSPIAEMPSALVEACRPVEMVAPTQPATVTAAEGISHPEKLLAAHLDAVARAPEGRRRVTLYGAARGVGRMVLAGAIDTADAIAVLTEAGRAAGQSTRETRAAIVGGFRAEGVAA